MFDLINNLLTDAKNVALLAIGVAALAGSIFVFMKTKSGGAAVGVLVLGAVAIAVGTNMETLADLLGDDINTRGGTNGDTPGRADLEWGTNQ